MGQSGGVRDFGRDLAVSHQDESRWHKFWRARFPDAEITRADEDMSLQQLGVDAVIRRPSGKHLLVEEKVRAGRFVDCFIEIYSEFYGPCHPKNKAGWSVHHDKATDLVAYAVRPLARAWLLPYTEYRAFAIDVIKQPGCVIRKSRTVTFSGATWETHHTSVDWDELYSALNLRERDVCFPW